MATYSPRSRPRRFSSEAGIAWWIIVIIIVIVVAVIAAGAGLYYANKPSSTVTQQTKVCPSGSIDVTAWLRGAASPNNYTVAITLTRKCELGQQCSCANLTGSFGTATTPCDSYGGITSSTSTDTVTPTGIATKFTKTFGNLQEGIWEVQLVVSVPGQPTLTRKCCVLVQSGNASQVTFGCQSLTLPGQVCQDCLQNTNPSGPPVRQPVN